MEGLRVLAVDDDRPFLAILKKMLLSCHYQATICSNGEDALSILREDKNTFDIILCDVEIPDVDGFKLLEVIRSKTDIPVVLMSGDDSSEAVKKSVINGACDFLVKPVTIEQVGVIWQHVLRRRQNGSKDNASRVSGTNTDKNEEDEEEEDEASPEHGTRAKKPRIIWTTELHEKFFLAVKQLGIDKAVPKKILECMQQMGVTELTRENVASHLQKFRLYVRKRNVDSLDQSGNSSSLTGLNGFDQPPPSLAGLNGFDQPSSSGHQFGSAQYRYGHGHVVPTPLHEQRKLLDPMMLLHSTQAHHLHGGVSANLGFGPGQELLPLGQPVLSFPDVGNSSLFESDNGYGHIDVVPRTMELGNVIDHDHGQHQQNNYSMDDRGVIMTGQSFVPNGHLYGELIKHEGFGGGGGLLSEPGSGHEAHLYSYEKDGPFFDQTL